MTFWRKPIVESTPSTIDSDQAWKVLLLVNDWIKYAEAKLGITLAAAGVSAGALFNLVKYHNESGWLFNTIATACCAGVVLAGAFSIFGLFPVLRFRHSDPNADANPIYFQDIAKKYHQGTDEYGTALKSLTSDRVQMLRHLCQQIYANSFVAERKYRWANRAIRALLLSMLALSALAAISAVDL